MFGLPALTCHKETKEKPFEKLVKLAKSYCVLVTIKPSCLNFKVIKCIIHPNPKVNCSFIYSTTEMWNLKMGQMKKNGTNGNTYLPSAFCINILSNWHYHISIA